MSLSNLFFDPDPFESDPSGFAGNQIGHFVIGLAGVWTGFPWVDVPWWDMPSSLAVILVTAAWELGQILRADGLIYDGIEDVTFFAAGALVLLWPPVAVLAILFLAAGAARRLPI